MTKKIYLNGTELPKDFSSGGIVDEVIISKDESRFAYVSPSGVVLIGSISADGIIQTTNGVIIYKKGSIMPNILLGGEGGLHPAGRIGNYNLECTASKVKVTFGGLEKSVMTVVGKGAVGIKL